MIRLTSAFLFAVTLLAGVYVAFWDYSTDTASTKLTKMLEQTFNGTVKYSGLKREYDLTHVNLNLKNLEITTKQNSVGQNAVLVFGNVNFISDFFGKYKMEINLPKNIVVHILQNNQPVKTYSVQMEKGKIILFPQQKETLFSWLVAIVRSSNKEVLRVGISDITVKNNSINLLFKNIKENLLADSAPLNLQTWILKTEFTGLPTMQNLLLPVLANPNVATLKEVTKQAITSAKNSNASLIISDWITRNNKQSFSASADLELDKRARLWGKAKITTSSKQIFKEFLQKSNLINSDEIDGSNINFARLFNRDSQAPFTYKINIRQGDVTINSLRIGIAEPLIKMLKL